MHNRGFTLIELLIVIAIIGLLATLSIISFSSSTRKARDIKRRSDLLTIQRALEVYYDEYNTYPTTAGVWRSYLSSFGGYPTSGPSAYIPNLSPTFIAKLPTDPKPMAHPELSGVCTADLSGIYYRSDGISYKLMSHCTIESGSPQPTDNLLDPIRPTCTLMVCNQNGAGCGW